MLENKLPHQLDDRVVIRIGCRTDRICLGSTASRTSSRNAAFHGVLEIVESSVLLLPSGRACVWGVGMGREGRS